MEDDGEKGKTHGNRLYLNLSAAHVEGERVSGEGDRCGDADSASAPARHLHAPTKRCENQSLFDAIMISYSDPPSAQTVRVQTVPPPLWLHRPRPCSSRATRGCRTHESRTHGG